jgi:hypothetical protein
MGVQKSSYENMPEIAVYPHAASISPTGQLLAVGGGSAFQLFHFNGSAPARKFSPAIAAGDNLLEFGWDRSNHLPQKFSGPAQVNQPGLRSFPDSADLTGGSWLEAPEVRGFVDRMRRSFCGGTELAVWENRQQTSHMESAFLKVPLPSVHETPTKLPSTKLRRNSDETPIRPTERATEWRRSRLGVYVEARVSFSLPVGLFCWRRSRG